MFCLCLQARSRRLGGHKLSVLKTSEQIFDSARMADARGRPPEDLRHSQKWSLPKILEPEIEVDTTDLRFVFDYNFHDEWQHVIEFLWDSATDYAIGAQC